MFRRSLIAGTAGALALPALGRAQALPKITIGTTPVPPRQIDSTAMVSAMVRKLEYASSM